MPSETFIFSSSIENGALNKSSDGSKFTINFDSPLFIPENAVNPKLAVISANIWNNSPNISALLNNNKFEIKDSQGTYSVTVPDGNYDIDTLNQTLGTSFDNLTPVRPFFPFSNYFAITGNNATQRVNIEFKYASSSADQQIIWANTTMRDLLGFDATSPTVPPLAPNPSHNTFLIAPSPARFNSYNSFIIHSSLVNNGIQLNNNFFNIISVIPITAPTGTLNIYQAQEPYNFSICTNLVGELNRKYSADFSLTDETNQPLNTSGEDYDFIILLSWE